LVFLDETSLNTKMARHYGRCPLGQRCLSAIPHGHWQSSTFIAALRHESIEAPFLIEGPVDAEVFTAYLEQVLCPQLRAGDTLILDNLATHKIHNVGQLLSARGVGVRYLPPYSPDLNPIELAFAKLKAHLRQAAARTLDDLLTALAPALSSFSPTHCRSFFRHARYASI
jgi:transposase